MKKSQSFQHFSSEIVREMQTLDEDSRVALVFETNFGEVYARWRVARRRNHIGLLGARGSPGLGNDHQKTQANHQGRNGIE